MANIFYLIVNVHTQAKWLSKNKNQRTNDVQNVSKSTSFLRTNVRKVTKWARQNSFAIEQCCVHWTFLYGSQVLRRLKIKLFSWWENNSIPFFRCCCCFGCCLNISRVNWRNTSRNSNRIKLKRDTARQVQCSMFDALSVSVWKATKNEQRLEKQSNNISKTLPVSKLQHFFQTIQILAILCALCFVSFLWSCNFWLLFSLSLRLFNDSNSIV